MFLRVEAKKVLLEEKERKHVYNEGAFIEALVECKQIAETLKSVEDFSALQGGSFKGCGQERWYTCSQLVRRHSESSLVE